MARKRRTFDVAQFTIDINKCLVMSAKVSPDHRTGLMTALEHLLHQTGNYRGFRYLTVNEVPPGERPGININPIDGEILDDMEAKFANTDHTRVAYYI